MAASPQLARFDGRCGSFSLHQFGAGLVLLNPIMQASRQLQIQMPKP
jgi:hypothetical protein